MTITESITKAMKDLGVPNDEVSLDNPEPEKEKPVKKTAKKGKAAEKDFSQCMNPPVDEADESPASEDTSEEENVVFCKIHNGKVALFFPKDYEFDVTTFGDVQLNTLTFEMPEVSSTKLQELRIIVKSEQIKRVPIFLSPEEKAAQAAEKKPAKKQKEPEPEGDDEITDENLAELTMEKARLDVKIKQARKDGDEDLVNELRKQRRIVRNKINKAMAGE